jgi:hypothetical protein
MREHTPDALKLVVQLPADDDLELAVSLTGDNPLSLAWKSLGRDLEQLLFAVPLRQSLHGFD